MADADDPRARFRTLAEAEAKGRDPEKTTRTPAGLRGQTALLAVRPRGSAAPGQPAGRAAVPPRRARHDVRGPALDAAPVRGVFDRRGDQRVLPQRLAAGQTGLCVAFDLATHRGYDSDHPRSWVMSARPASPSIVEDMKSLFDGIPLEDVSVSMTMNGAALPVFAVFIVAAEEQGVPGAPHRDDPERHFKRVHGAQHVYLPARALDADRGGRDRVREPQLPRFNRVSISGYHMQEAGATAHQELAYTLADGLEYVRAVLGRGLDWMRSPRASPSFSRSARTSSVEVAKLRAARLLWARLMRERFAPRDPRSLRCACTARHRA